jgi:hypothetical protein
MLKPGLELVEGAEVDDEIILVEMGALEPELKFA